MSEPENKILTEAEYYAFLRGMIGTGFAIRKGYFSTDDPLANILTAAVEAMAIARDQTPAEVTATMARDAAEAYDAEGWAERLRYLSALAEDVTERYREDLVGNELDFRKKHARP